MFLYFAEATILSLCCKDKYFFLVLQRQLIFIGGNCFLSDPRSIISYPCHKQAHSLPHCCIVDLMDVSLACEDSNSKLVKVVTVADIDAGKRVDDSLVELNPWVRCHFDNILSYNHCGIVDSIRTLFFTGFEYLTAVDDDHEESESVGLLGYQGLLV